MAEFGGSRGANLIPFIYEQDISPLEDSPAACWRFEYGVAKKHDENQLRGLQVRA
jgi:hypothetical protein